jgi:manganese oxidase
VGLLLVTGWTGGELAYRHMVGVTGHGGEGPAHASEERTATGGHPRPHDGSSQPPSSAGSGTAPAPSPQHGGHQGHAGTGGMAGMGGGPVDVAFRVTRPQLAAVALASVVLLAGALLFSASRVNLGLGAHDVGGLVMPPGMIMTRDTPGQAMRDMAAVDPAAVSYRAPVDARGDQPLHARLEAGVKVYDLETSVIEWNILPYERVMAYAFNRQVPGPRITVTEGDRLRFNVTNRLPEPTTVHWHGLVVPNAMDGPAEITQEPIPPGGSFTYQFTARQAGTFFYHSHSEVDRQQALGLYGALIVQPKAPSRTPQADQELVVQLQEWNEREGYTFPAMPMEGTLPNFFTINGKAYPATETVHLRVGQRLLVRFIGSSSAFIHPMHIHGGPFEVVATDGVTLPEPARYEKDTVNVGPGERYDVVWTAREPGKWLLHCHINHHTTNDNVEEQGGGGLTLILNVSG